eukprot:COSAG01_NODE_7529_length_3165_cov_3.172864_1_plen_79_part_00
MGTATGSLGDMVMSVLGSMSLKVSPVPFVTYKSTLVSKVTRGYHTCTSLLVSRSWSASALTAFIDTASTPGSITTSYS